MRYARRGETSGNDGESAYCDDLNMAAKVLDGGGSVEEDLDAVCPDLEWLIVDHNGKLVVYSAD